MTTDANGTNQTTKWDEINLAVTLGDGEPVVLGQFVCPAGVRPDQVEVSRMLHAVADQYGHIPLTPAIPPVVVMRIDR